MEFRELFHDITDIDPFTTLTIASSCHLVYRTSYHPKDTIAIIPPLGYCPKKNNHCLSINGFRTRGRKKKSIYRMHVTIARNVLAPICSAATMKKPILRTKSTAVFGTDVPMLHPRYGYCESGKRQYHAGTSLFHSGKIEYLKRQGYNVVEIWECDVNRE